MQTIPDKQLSTPSSFMPHSLFTRSRPNPILLENALPELLITHKSNGVISTSRNIGGRGEFGREAFKTAENKMARRIENEASPKSVSGEQAKTPQSRNLLNRTIDAGRVYDRASK